LLLIQDPRHVLRCLGGKLGGHNRHLHFRRIGRLEGLLCGVLPN
jgi:hypothetical protein